LGPAWEELACCASVALATKVRAAAKPAAVKP